jgi:hypothetical protein
VAHTYVYIDCPTAHNACAQSIGPGGQPQRGTGMKFVRLNIAIVNLNAAIVKLNVTLA